MDNNFLAFDAHAAILRDLAFSYLKVDFNQGLDARLVTDLNAFWLAKIKWIRFIRFSCDTPEMREKVRDAVALVRQHGYSGEVFCYVLVRDIGEAHETVKFLMSIGVDPFAQAFADYTEGRTRTVEQQRFCNWCNKAPVRKTTPWENYQSTFRRKRK